MSDLLAFSASCVLLAATTEVESAPDAWRERTTWEIGAKTHGCTSTTLTLPPGVRLAERDARARLGDDSKRDYGDERWFVGDRGLDDIGAARLVHPELVGGDRVFVTATRVWPKDRYPFDAAPDRAALEAAGGAALAAARATPPDPGDGPVSVQRTITLVIDGDPQQTLMPGGGSSIRVEEVVRFGELDRPRMHLVRLHDGHGPVTPVDPPPEGVELTLRDDAAIVTVAPPGDVTVALRWEAPDAPAAGEIAAEPGADVEVVVTDPDGRVRRDGAFWWLAEHDGRPVIPDRESVLRGLDYRFRVASLPEPALPLVLRGMPTGWELVEQLRPSLHERVRVVPLAGDPLFPRKLNRAKKSEVVTPVEAALTLRAWAIQAHVRADWALVRPADRGPGHPIAPVGYDEALVRIDSGRKVAWIDPGCGPCAPFELRPHLEGASAYSPIAIDTPPPTAGAEAVWVEADAVRARLAGPAALLVRLALEGVPPDDRGRALAERVAGPGATLTSADGIGEAGRPIEVVARGVARDPLALPDARADGARWWGWVGGRQIERPGELPPGKLERDGFTYERTVAGGRVTERLVVRDRAMSTADADLLLVSRQGWRPSPEAVSMLELPADAWAPDRIGAWGRIERVRVTRDVTVGATSFAAGTALDVREDGAIVTAP